MSAVALDVPSSLSLPAGAFSWPPADRYWHARKPVGGFAFMAPDHLLLPWQAYQQERIDALALRGVLAAREMRERRCQLVPGVQPQYGPQELGGLLGLPPKRRRQADAVQHQLTTTGLLTWTESTLAFCHHPEQVRGLDLAVYTARRALVPAWLQRVPVPRHLLQYLARAGSPGLIATACGVLLQCLRYRDHQCVAGGHVSAPWIAACCGLSERTAARGLAQLTALGWLATVEEAHRHAQGPWRVVNLQWDFPRVRLVAPTRDTRPATRQRRPVQLELFPSPALVPARREAPAAPDPAARALPTAPANTPAPTANQDVTREVAATALTPEVQAQLWAQATANLRVQGIAEAFLIRPVIETEVARLLATPPASPPAEPTPGGGDHQEKSCQNLAACVRLSRHNVSASSPSIPSNDAENPSSLQPLREIQNPEPAHRGPTGACLVDNQSLPPGALLIAPDNHVAATTVLEPDASRGSPVADRLLTPNAMAIRAQIAASLAHAASQHPALPAALRAPPPAPAPAPALAPPTLRDVRPADLGDVGSLLALWAQAQQRGWVTGSAADRLHVVAAAVHARRIGQAPCRLFVALLRDRRWEVITQDEEDTACAWLRTSLDGPAHRAEPEPVAPPPARVVPRSKDADVVDALQRGLPPAWRDRPFLALKLQDPTWTRARWEQAQAELTQWRLLQAQANARSQRASLGAILDREVSWEDAGDAE